MPESKKKREKIQKVQKPTQAHDIGKSEKSDERAELEDKKISPKDKKALEKELIEIYKDQNGEMPDMSKIYRKKRSRAKMVLIGLIIFFAFLAVLSWAGFFFFGPKQTFSGEKVNLEVAAPETAAGGEQIEYVIKYQNNETVPLGQAAMEVRYPDHFVLEETEPISAEGKNLWQLGSIAVGGSGEVKIRGSLRGALQSLETMQAVLTYKPADFNSEFQKVAAAVTKIDKSFLETEIVGPVRVLAKAETKFKVKYKNTAAYPLSNVKISIAPPADFALAKKEEEKEVTSWEISEVGAGSENEIEFAGSFGEAAEGEREFKVQIGLSQDNDFYLQKENVFKTNVIQGIVILNLILNGEVKDRAVNFGDTLNYSIAYQNKSQVELGDLEIKMTFESTSRNNKMVLDWSALKDDNDGVVLGAQISPEVRQGTITWTKRQIGKLAKLAPGEEGTIDFQMKVKPFSEVKGWGIKEFQVKNLATVKVGKVGDEVKEETAESNPIVFKINTDLALQSEARYFNDDNIALGNGPLPPKVGETTAYRIFWTVTNSLHEVENLKVSTVLPENVNWSNKFEIEAGDLKFDETTREVAWTLNRMPLDVGELGINFEVTVTPVEADKGKLLTLIFDTNLQATDKSTNGTINKTGGALTSNLDSDPMAEGKGIVK